MYYETGRKKIALRVLIILCIIMTIFVTAISGALAADQDYAFVRVKLSVGTPSVLSFFVDGNYTVGEIELERQQYTVKKEGSGLKLYYGSELVYDGTSIRLVQHEATAGRNSFIYLYNSYQNTYLAYSGDIEFSIDTSSSCIQAVNRLFIEDYLLGVVPYEMSDSWPVDALKTQTVAARNYVISKMNGTGTYDVVDTTANQVYKGYSASLTNTLTAVEQTAGEVLTYGGQIAEMFYSASNGGWTEIPQHVWTATNPLFPYHVIKQDPYDLLNSWSVQEALVLPKTITETDVISYEYFSEGSMVPVTGQESSEIVNAKKWLEDAALPKLIEKGYGIIDSLAGIESITPHTYDTSSGQHHGGLADDNGNVVYDGNDYNGENNCPDFINADITMTVNAKTDAEAEAVPVSVSFEIDMAALADAESQYFVFSRHPKLRLFTVEETDTQWRIWHRRNGHGIGISQRGAQQRAKDADPEINAYDKILGFYYPGAALAVKSYSMPALTAVTVPDHSNAVMVADRVNVRSGPGTSHGSLGRLPLGARIEVIEANAAAASGITWHKILYGGQYAYVAANYNSETYVQIDDPQPPRESFTVSFAVNGGSAVSALNVQHGDSILSSPATSRAGFTFGGWHTDSALKKPAVFPYIVTRDSTLYAKWGPVSYTISYSLNGGKASNPASYTALSGAFTLNNPVKAGYDFVGWSGTGISGMSMKVIIPAGSSGSRSYTANWKQQPVYTISYNLNGGKASNPASYTALSGAITLNNPVRPGYDFIGWSGTGISGLSMKVIIPAGSGGNRSYTANWKQQITSAYLTGVKLSAGALSPSFSKTRYSYKVSLTENQGSVKISPIKEYSGASMTIAGKSVSSYTVSVANGKSAKVYVKVKYGRTTKTYKLTVTRAKSTNNNLAVLSASAGKFDKPFNPAVTGYTLTLDENTKSTKIYDTVASSYARASFKSKSVSLSNGQSKTIKLTVKAQSGARKTYVITVKRAPSTSTALKYLKTNSKSYPLTPAFSTGKINYTITLPVNKNKVTISAKAAGYKASVYFDGAKRSSKKVTLQPGQSQTVRVTVRAQSGAEKVYTITVRRLISTDANLKSLKVSSVLSPVFRPGTVNYTVTLPAKSSSLTLRASANGYGAKVTIDGRSASSKKIKLQPGQSVTVRVKVRAQSGAEKEYFITAKRPQIKH